MKFYTYTWLRENGSPWYVGKGCGNRAYQRRKGHWAPKHTKLITIQYWPDEETAFAYKMYLIDFWGRKDLGTGILFNRANGGENPPVTFSKPWLKGKIPWNKGLRGLGGYKWSEESKTKLSKSKMRNQAGLGVPCSEEKRNKIRRSLEGHVVSLETREKISSTLKSKSAAV